MLSKRINASILQSVVHVVFIFAEDLSERIININNYFTFSLYSNVCRSLFEKHKLLFSFLLCARILMHDNKIDMVRSVSIFSIPCLAITNAFVRMNVYTNYGIFRLIKIFICIELFEFNEVMKLINVCSELKLNFKVR